MKATKQRLSASIDAELIDAAEAAAKRGEVANVSAWVNEAMRLKLEHDRGLAELGAVIADFEHEHGVITSADVDKAVRAAQARALRVRGARAGEEPAKWSGRRRR